MAFSHDEVDTLVAETRAVLDAAADHFNIS